MFRIVIKTFQSSSLQFVGLVYYEVKTLFCRKEEDTIVIVLSLLSTNNNFLLLVQRASEITVVI